MFPIIVNEYTVSKKVSEEPSFYCLVMETIFQLWRSINKVKSKYCKIAHTFFLELSKSDKEAFKIGSQTGNKIFCKSIEKEIAATYVAFEFNKYPRVGYTNIICHIFFDIKMYFTRKTHFVPGLHLRKLH